MDVLTFDLAGGRKTQHRSWLKELQSQGKLNKEIEERPEIIPEALEFWDAYIILASRRTFNEGNPQPILLSEINSYCQLVDMVEREFLLRLVLNLDTLYLQHHAKQAQ
jgi:hypothetical protein